MTTKATMPLTLWLDRVMTTAGVSHDDLERVVGGKRQRDRAIMWYRDGMTYEMAAQSLREMTRQIKIGERADREINAMHGMMKVAGDAPKRKTGKQLDAEVAAFLHEKPTKAKATRLSKAMHAKLRATLRRTVQDEIQAAGSRELGHDEYQRAGEDAIKICGLYGRAVAQAGDSGVEIWEIVNGEPNVDAGAFVRWSAEREGL